MARLFMDRPCILYICIYIFSFFFWPLNFRFGRRRMLISFFANENPIRSYQLFSTNIEMIIASLGMRNGRSEKLLNVRNMPGQVSLT